MRRRSLILALLLTVPAFTGCIVPEDMTALREELGYAAVERPDLVVKARASTLNPTVTETVDLTAETTGLTGSQVEIEWTVANTTYEGSQIEVSFDEPGPKDVRVEATGPNGTTATDEIELDVQPNEAPTPELVIEDRDALRADQPVTFRASGSQDPDGDPLTFDWRIDGEPVEAGETLTRTLEAGAHEVQLTVSDGHVSRSTSQAFGVDLPVRHDANVSATQTTAELTLPVAPGADELAVQLTHTTNAGLDDVNLTLEGPEGEVLARSDREPEPGASEGTEKLEVDGSTLDDAPHTLVVRHVRGGETSVTIEGVLTYSPLPGEPS